MEKSKQASGIGPRASGFTDADGVVWIEDPAWRRLRPLLGVAAVVLLGIAGWWMLQPRPVPPPVAAPQSERVAPAPSQPAPPDPMQRAVRRALEPRPVVAQDRAPAPEPEPDAEREVTVEQLPPGDGTGIQAFPKPGTKPLKRGIIVPDGYTLPPGYVRHYQTTDDGEQLPPILMFHPDYRPLGPDGQPLPMPADRIVPQELAPSGMPVRMLEPPPVRKERR